MKSVSQIKKILITGGSGMVGRNFIEHPDIDNLADCKLYDDFNRITGQIKTQLV